MITAALFLPAHARPADELAQEREFEAEMADAIAHGDSVSTDRHR